MRPLAPLPLVAAPPGPCPRRVAHVAHRRRRPAPGAHRTKPHGVLPIEVNRVDALNTKWMPRAVAAVAAKQGPGAAAHVAHIVIGARLTRGGGRIAALPIGFITRWAAQPAPHHPRRPRCAPDLWLRQRGQAVARADAIAAVVAKSPAPTALPPLRRSTAAGSSSLHLTPRRSCAVLPSDGTPGVVMQRGKASHDDLIRRRRHPGRLSQAPRCSHDEREALIA